MALGKLWVFGDSFDYGSEVSIAGEPYYDKYRTEGDYHYSLHLGKKLKLEVFNHAKPSFGPYHTIYYLSQQLKNIKPEDYIVVGMSDAHRLVGFKENRIPKSNLHDPEPPGNIISTYAHWSKEDEVTRRELNFISPSFFDDVTKYSINCVEPFIQEHLQFVNIIVGNIMRSINCKKSFTYNTNTWFDFESIKAATNGKIDDMHWSFKGNKDFSKHILDIWENHNHYHSKDPDMQKEFKDDPFILPYWSPDNPDKDPYNIPINKGKNKPII